MDKFTNVTTLLSSQDLRKLKTLSFISGLKQSDVIRVLIEVTFHLEKQFQGELFTDTIQPLVTYAPEKDIKAFYLLLNSLYERANVKDIYTKNPPQHKFLNRKPNTAKHKIIKRSVSEKKRSVVSH